MGIRYKATGESRSRNVPYYKELDTFLQKYERPYGDVYRYAILAEVNDTRLPASVPAHGHAEAGYTRFSVKQWSRPSFEWCIALLVGLTVFVGTISNVLTQGYYRSEISNWIFGLVLLGFSILVILVFLWQF